MIDLLAQSALVALASAFTYHTFFGWLGWPDAESGEVKTGMIFSRLGGWLLAKRRYAGPLFRPVFKVALCPYCASVWICFLFCWLFELSWHTYLLAPAFTGPAVNLTNRF
jgi:hypothetical protein